MNARSFLQKFVACFLAGLSVMAATLRIGRRFISPWIPLPVIAAFAFIFFVSAIVLAVVWHRREKAKAPDASSPLWMQLNFWQALLRYAVALDLSMFGWQKIFHLQMVSPLGLLDLPFSSLSGEDLTWSYFGHSYPMVVAIGSLQILGSFLLLFNRTRLLALFTLLPVLLNIVLIDFFYGLDWGERLYASVIFGELLYLLLSEYDRLVEFFFKAQTAMPSVVFKNMHIKKGMRLSVIGIPLLLIAAYENPDKHPSLTGKYNVTKLQLNHATLKPGTCQDSVLTTVYLDVGNDVVFEFNNPERRLIGHYTYAEQTGKLDAAWHYPPTFHTPLQAILTSQNDSDLTLTGTMGEDQIIIEMHKIRGR
ncbi:hypothetical protein [Chryseolinea soli]|uniref:DoxX family protein n=1 Tax=Chryseolinea soli TaxID=2321403 RepID=A0A385SNL8_9BACT|nr:hypothetical protein [Chryseolinea soli]AYB31847.1 hypothetical protein D4L85_15300 [Chryseolinea soli]